MPGKNTRRPNRKQISKIPLLAAFLFFLGVETALCTCAQTPGQSPPESASFAARIQADFQTGASGDATALERALKICEAALAENPKHAEALVWHGSGVLVKSGQAFQQGDFQTGGALWDQAFVEMDKAVSLEPKNPDVLLVRGQTALQASRGYPVADVAHALLEKGVADLEQVIELRNDQLDKLPVQVRGQLLLGLGGGWNRLENSAKAKAYLERTVKECPGTPYAERAAAALEKLTAKQSAK